MRGPIEIIADLELPPVTGVLQIGANAGQELGYFVSNGITLGAFIEPLDGPFGVLQQRCAEVPGFLPVHALCASRDGDLVEFHVATNNGESSSLFSPRNHLTDYPHVQFPTRTMMHAFTLDRIFAVIGVQRPEIAQAVNLLYMDVQGAELEVLKAASSVLRQVDYIHTEVGLGGGYQDDVELDDLIQFLKVYGFRLYELEIGRTGWGNAMFIRHSVVRKDASRA